MPEPPVILTRPPARHRGMDYENQVPTLPPLRVAAIDPGVRTFATIYSAGCDIADVTEFGVNDYGRIYNLCRHADKLQSMWAAADCRAKKRRGLKKAAKRISSKVRNLVDDLHRKLAAFLVDAYDVILLPKFETRGMVHKPNRRINSKTAATRHVYLVPLPLPLPSHPKSALPSERSSSPCHGRVYIQDMWQVWCSAPQARRIENLQVRRLQDCHGQRLQWRAQRSAQASDRTDCPSCRGGDSGRLRPPSLISGKMDNGDISRCL